MFTALHDRLGPVSVVCTMGTELAVVIADKPEPHTRHVVEIKTLRTSSLSREPLEEQLKKADLDLNGWISERHNGWTNVETWEAYNWLSSDEAAYEHFQYLKSFILSTDKLQGGLKAYIRANLRTQNPTLNSFSECAVSRINWTELIEKL
jgi:hypothetical protein